MEPGDSSVDATEGAAQPAPCGKEAVRAWLRRRREAREAPPSIEQIRAELGWTHRAALNRQLAGPRAPVDPTAT